MFWLSRRTPFTFLKNATIAVTLSKIQFGWSGFLGHKKIKGASAVKPLRPFELKPYSL
jgi:hypothetical protein